LCTAHKQQHLLGDQHLLNDQYFINMIEALILAGLASAVVATSAPKLLVTSQSQNASLPGQILTLAMTPSAKGTDPQNLSVVQTSIECGILPTWLDVSIGSDVLLCLDESFAPNLTALHIQENGSLQAFSQIAVDGGPVALSTYVGHSDIALAHFNPPKISLLTVGVDKSFESLQNFTFDTSINANATPPTGSKIHQAVLDPTGQYMLFPDLGADLVHVYGIDTDTGGMIELGPLVSKKDSGPRHAVFFQPDSNNSTDTFLFVIHEISSRIVSYKVNYLNPVGISFTLIQDIGTFGTMDVPPFAKAAEIAISPDNQFVVASNRNATIFNATNPDPTNSTLIPSDSLLTLKPHCNGTLEFVQLVPSGGFFPRHFQMNGDGSMIAVANQLSQNVVVFERDVKTGLIGKEVAGSKGMLGVGGLTYVQWIDDDSKVPEKGKVVTRSPFRHSRA
jgi:6-phosphogluconolactonase (cycloisomerase 2 family)